MFKGFRLHSCEFRRTGKSVKISKDQASNLSALSAERQASGRFPRRVVGQASGHETETGAPSDAPADGDIETVRVEVADVHTVAVRIH